MTEGIKIENIKVSNRFWLEKEGDDGIPEFVDGYYQNVIPLMAQKPPFAKHVRIMFGNDHKYKIMYEYNKLTGEWDLIEKWVKE
jgi:hypothetical protein